MKHLAVIPLFFITTATAYAYEFTNADLCKAAVATDMAREANIMKTREAGDIPVITYTRDDGESFTYRCKVVGNKVVWSGFIDGQWGRWRDSADYGDSTITFEVVNDTLKVHNDSTGTDTSFNATDFQ